MGDIYPVTTESKTTLNPVIVPDLCLNVDNLEYIVMSAKEKANDLLECNDRGILPDNIYGVVLPVKL